MKSIIYILLLAVQPAFCTVVQVSADSTKSPSIDQPTIKHIVKENETLYSLLRLYNCSRAQFEALNPNMKGSNLIKVNQKLTFPSKSPIEPGPSENEEKRNTSIIKERSVSEINQEIISEVSDRMLTTVHTVQDGETMYSISKRYAVDIDKIKQVNHLNGIELSVGQKLIIRQTEQQMQSVAEINFDKQPDKIIIPDIAKAEKVEEAGIAELIQTAKKGNQMLALHKTAPLGSLMTVKNIATGQQIVVKVIGKLPETGNNENVLIRLSPTAFYRLGPKDIKFSARVTYYLPPNI